MSCAACFRNSSPLFNGLQSTRAFNVLGFQFASTQDLLQRASTNARDLNVLGFQFTSTQDLLQRASASASAFLGTQLLFHVRGQFRRACVINGAWLPSDCKPAAIFIFRNNMKVHMHHFLMRHGSVVLQNVVRGCAGGFQNCGRNQW